MTTAERLNIKRRELMAREPQPNRFGIHNPDRWLECALACEAQGNHRLAQECFERAEKSENMK